MKLPDLSTVDLGFIDLSQLAYNPPGRGRLLLIGLLATVQIAIGAYLLGLTIGFLGALGKLYGSRPVKWFLEGYTTIVRAVPELVLILLVFYAGSGLVNEVLRNFGYRPIDINALLAGIVVLGIVMGAYATEVMRGAITAIPKGQLEAARAFGMSGRMTLRRIIAPAMMPLAIPGLSNLWLIVLKDTALLAVIGSIELATRTRQAGATTREYLTFYLAALVLYLLLTLVSMYLIRHVERYFRRGLRGANT
ncbi:MAG: ABC transporter permease subunit [Pseudomonadota bacterium]